MARKSKNRECITENAKKLVDIVPRTISQKNYCRAISENTIVIATGAAGTGKTYLAGLHAVRAFVEGEVNKIVVCRPAIPAGGEDIGFLPGEINEKMLPYIRPVWDAFMTYWTPKIIAEMVNEGLIEILPLAFARGRTFKDSFVIADEMQNCTLELFRMLLTRLGEGSKMVITGDPTQTDLRNGSVLHILRRKIEGIPGIAFVDFGKKDIVRHPLVEQILQSWEKEPEPVEYVSLPAFLIQDPPPLANGKMAHL